MYGRYISLRPLKKNVMDQNTSSQDMKMHIKDLLKIFNQKRLFAIGERDKHDEKFWNERIDELNLIKEKIL